ncbi:right-handed parallel beta-helix repeat-containing protein [Pleurocapsa sp. PCC 7319]|uniref:right-handed parallel beta-helix repeat-containing protein n=1 Tax=Pleurocapsa sp. PCC 7319 TaxID=118161 RepID=UPI00034A3424|nr:right-handed parallel beta-helix repeat-containing protein [Pleurocapsa sp. PCC 7319]
MTTFTVSNIEDSGAGSFRDAIIGANQSSGLDEIIFDIPGSEPHTIQALSPLPDITDSVIIDGTTQSGYAGTLIIKLNGENTGDNVDGLTITADGSGSIIQGLAIHSFSGDGIILDGSDSNQISGNYIGTDSTGIIDLGNQGNGISLINGADNNLIGGTSGANLSSNASDALSLGSEGNLILGNDGDGIELSGSGTNLNQITNNYIGTDVTGTQVIANEDGVSVNDGSSENIINHNLISGNLDDGVPIADPETIDSICL